MAEYTVTEIINDDDLGDEALDERHGAKYTCGGSRVGRS